MNRARLCVARDFTWKNRAAKLGCLSAGQARGSQLVKDVKDMLIVGVGVGIWYIVAASVGGLEGWPGSVVNEH